MKDLFPNKKFVFINLKGVSYISKDAYEALMKGRDKEELKFLKKLVEHPKILEKVIKRIKYLEGKK